MVQLPVPQRLRDAVCVVERGHLLVPDLGVDSDQFRVREIVDEGDRVADRRQQDVTARLVRLRLQREPDFVALLAHIRAEDVHRLLVAVECGADILRTAGLGALTTTPEHVRRRAELSREIDVAEHLRQRVPADLTVVRGQAAVLEDGVGEQVRGHHLDRQPGVGQRLGEPLQHLLAGRFVGYDVVVVERDRGGPQLRELLHRVDRVHRRADRRTEDVDALPADGPQTEGELVVLRGGVAVHSGISCHCRDVELASTAASTRWTRSPSANDGSGSAPSAIAVTRSTT